MCLSAFFSGSESALFSLDHVQKKRMEASSSGRRALRLLEHPDRLLSSILLGNTLVNVAASTVASLLVMDLVEGDAALGISVIGMTFLLLIFGEISPKAYATAHAQRVSEAVSRPLSIFVGSVSILSVLLARTSHAFVRLFGPAGRPRKLSEAEVISLLELGHSEGVLGREALVTVSLLSLGERQCRQAMVPRSEASVIRRGWNRDRILSTVRESGYTRYPLLDDPGDSVAGFVDSREILSWSEAEGEAPGVYPMPFFPENAPLDDALDELRSCGSGIGAVFDEYGDWIGIITVDDILEFAVFHSMSGRKDLPEGVHRSGDGFVVPGSLRVETVEKLMDCDIDPEFAETCGGFFEEVTGRIPSCGEGLSVGGVRMTVLTMEGRRIGRMLVEKTEGGDSG